MCIHLIRVLFLEQKSPQASETPPSLEVLQKELEARDNRVEELTRLLSDLTQQIDQLKKDENSLQSLQQKLQAREKKVKELTKQLEALRRIDQEIREKTPPTQPPEKIVVPEVPAQEETLK